MRHRGVITCEVVLRDFRHIIKWMSSLIIIIVSECSMRWISLRQTLILITRRLAEHCHAVSEEFASSVMPMNVYYCYFELETDKNKKHFRVLRRLAWRHALRANETAPSRGTEVTCITVGKYDMISSLKRIASAIKIQFRNINNIFYLYVLKIRGVYFNVYKSPLFKRGIC